MVFVLQSSPNKTPIKYIGPIKKTYQLEPTYVNSYLSQAYTRLVLSAFHSMLVA